MTDYDDQPTVAQPTVTDPTLAEPTLAEPTEPEPTEAEPAVAPPTVAQPSAPWLASPPPPPPGQGEEPVVDPARRPGLRGAVPPADRPRAAPGHSTPPPGTPPGPAGGSSLAAGPAALKAGVNHLRDRSPWVLAAGGVLLAFVVEWFSSALGAFRHAPGLTGQARVLLLFAPGSFEWAAAMVLGLALVAAGRRFDLGSAALDKLNEAVSIGLLLGSTAVGVSAAVGILVELASFGHGINAALSGLIGYLGVLPVAAAATWWAYRLHSSLHGRR